MADATSNDNGLDRPTGKLEGPDAHGQAAMLLVESLMHGLISRSVISVADAVEIVGVAVDVKDEFAAEMGDTAATMEKSLAILGAIRASLIHDLPEATG